MTHPYAHLLSPGRIGRLELRNRIVMTPMGTNLEAADGHLGERALRYYEARALGGAGLLVAGVAAVSWPVGACNPNQAAISSDAFLPDWQELARRVHRHGARLAVQLQHAGKVAVEDIAAGRALQVPSALPPKAPDLFEDLTPQELETATSALRAPGASYALHEMTEDDIAGVVSRFAEAAERVQRAGADAVELHAGHGYLIQSFLSPAANRRTDAYGGAIENRARLLVETLRAVRERAGPDFPVWCRIDGVELGIEGGIGLQDAQRTAELAEAAGADAIHVSAYADPTVGAAFTDAPLVHEPGRYLPLAAGIKERVGVPVIAVGRIEPEVGERVLREGGADFIAMGRRLLADPELPRKLASESEHEARPCIYAYTCVGNVFLRRGARCTVNPELGREAELAPERARQPRRVAVIGAGPAGLELARAAALRGHQVHVFERDDEPGGRARQSARLDPALARWLDYLVRSVETAGATVECGRDVDVDGFPHADFDMAVVATGARLETGALAPDDRFAFAFDRAPLEQLGKRIAVVGNDVIAVTLAAHLVRSGRAVTLLGAGTTWAPQMSPPKRWRALHELDTAGAVRISGAHASLDGATLRYSDRDGATHTLDCDAALIATGLVPDTSLATALRARGVHAEAIGDCDGPRYLEASLLEAARLARSL